MPPVVPGPQGSRRPPAHYGAADEFGTLPSQAQASRHRPSYTPPIAMPPPSAPVAYTTPLHASSVSHAAQSQTQMPIASAAARKRQSHNPTSTLQSASPPKPEYLTDEYVLHPSVWAYKQAHPRRPMVGFGPYVLLQTLGEGEFGKVKLGVHTEFGVEVAIKLIRRGSLDDEVRASKVEREIDVLKTLRHPNIVRMFDVIDTEKYIGIVLEFAGGGELFDHILANRYLKEKDAQKLFAQLISGVDYLHKKHIVHRDLKLENLLLDKHRNIIITDFGFANRFNHATDDLMATSCGSPCYAAPELVVSEGLYVGSAVDIWSCGVILYAMLSGYLPYDDDPANPDGDNINLLYKYIMSTKLNFPDHITALARHLLQIMLVPNPEHRCTIDDIMAHPWLSQYREDFGRSVEEQEALFQENMHRKSQMAKRELNARKQLQQEAKQARVAMMRSQSSAPGTGVTASMLDERRRRPFTAIAGSSTIPINLEGAGRRTPPLDAIAPQQISSIAIPPLPQSASSSISMPEGPSVPLPLPAATNMEIEARVRAQSMAPALTQTQSDKTTATTSEAVENESMDIDAKGKTPMSANINRHTIQVEYDVDASYERVQAELESYRTAKPVISTQPPLENATSDIEMDSNSEHLLVQGQEAIADTVDSASSGRPTPELSQVVTPMGVIIPPVVEEVKEELPGTPTREAQSNSEPEQAASPSTPRASTATAAAQRFEVERTPKAQKTLPPSAQPTPRQQGTTTAGRSSLNAAGLPKPPPPSKANRRSKGMSLDKFGLARLLGQIADEPRSAPPSSGAAAAAIQRSQTAASVSAGKGPTGRPRTGDATADKEKDKKSRRRTLQLMGNRSSSPRDGKTTVATPTTATPLSPRDTNAPQPQSPPVVISNEGIHPQAHERERSSASVVTIDAVAPQPGNQKGASSNAAKKVMDWFRRKSLAKDTLSHLNKNATSHDDGDNDSTTGSFVRISESASRGPRIDTIAAAMSSTSSIAPTAEGNPALSMTEVSPEPGHSPRDRSTPSPEARLPLASADNKANISAAQGPTSTISLLPPARLEAPTSSSPSKSAANTPTSTVANLPSSTKMPQSSAALASRTYDESKMSVHHGVVDQSTLSSKPPREVMQEVINVLLDMGIDVKRENEFKLRCVRVRRRKAGATTGLGLGSVMSVGSGMNPFSLMGNASTSRVDSRGLPMPNSSSVSSGLKGMLLRRGSSYSSHAVNLSRAESNIVLSSPSLTSLAAASAPVKEPLYGEHSVDSGDEVKFHVELCRIKNLPGLYSLTIKRIKGSVWSFKFIYQTVVERCTTLTH